MHREVFKPETKTTTTKKTGAEENKKNSGGGGAIKEVPITEENNLGQPEKTRTETTKEEEKKGKIYIVDITEEIQSVVHQLAEEATAKYINSLRERRGWFGKIIGGIKSSFAELSRSYIYHQYRKQIEEEITKNYNIFQRIAIEGNKVNINERDLGRMNEFLRLAINRFEAQVADRFSRDVEIGKKIESNDLTEIKNLVTEIVRDFITQPDLDTPEGRVRFNQEFSRRIRLLISQNKLSPDLFHGEADKRIADSPEHFSTNIYDYVVSLKRQIGNISQKNNLTPEQGRQLNEFVQNLTQIDVKLGKLVSSIRTKLPDAGKKGTSDYTLNYVERLCLSLENVPILNKLINPVTVGLAAGILSKEGMVKIGGRGLAAAAGASVIGSLGYLTFPIITGSILAGAFSYFRSKARFKQDVGRILREEAAGLEITDKRAQQILERIALPGGEDFRMRIYDLIESINKGEENSYVEAAARLELEYESRIISEDLPQLDLLISSGIWRSSYIEKYELEKAILGFEGRIASEEKKRLREEINRKKQELINNIRSQDQKIKQESRKVATRNGVITGAAAFVIGSTVQYLRDLFGETALGEKLSEHPFLGAIFAAPKAKERVELIEYLLGERPRVGKEGFTSININGEELNIPYSQRETVGERVIALPEGGDNYGTIKWEQESQQWILGLSEEAKKSGWTITENGFSLKKGYVQGNLIESWSQIKDFLSQSGHQTKHIRWIDFAYEKKHPQVISWEVPSDHPGFHGEALEMSLSYKEAPDGSVIVRVPVKGVAFRPGKEWNIEEFVNNMKAGIALSPRHRVLQHETLVFPIKPEDIKGNYGEISIPKEIADIFFYKDGDNIKLNSSQITYNLFLDDERAVSVAADYNSEGFLVNIPPIEESVPVKITDHAPIPPIELDPPIPIPPLIDWKTAGTGEYKKPLFFKGPEHYYYTGNYFATLDWVRRFGLDEKLSEEERQTLNKLEEELLVLAEERVRLKAEIKSLENESEKEKLDKKRQELKNLRGKIYRIRKKIREINLGVESRLINKYIENVDNVFDSVFDKEVIERLFQINNYQGKSYRGFIEHLVKEQNIPEMERNCSVSIFIPAYMEGKNIYRTLDKYKEQKDYKNKPLDPSVYEIVVLVNKRESENWDNTEEEIKNFKAKNPNFRIHVVKCDFPKEIASVGLARRILTDIILFRYKQREKRNSHLYLISEDADLEEVDEKIVYTTIARFERYPWLDALRGLQVRNPEMLTKNYLLWLSRTGSQMTEYLMRSHKNLPEEWYYRAESWPDPFSWSRVVTGGWCTSFKALSLALIGGYDPRMRAGEDLFVGNGISIARSKENDKNGNPIPNLKTIKTMPVAHVSSMRRFMFEFSENVYEKFGSENLEKLIRTANENDILRQLTEVEEKRGTKEIFENIINSHIGTLINLTLPEYKEGQRRGEIYLTLFLLRKDRDYRWKNDREVELLDTGVDRIKFLFELFKLFINQYGTTKLIKRKLGIWPIWAGFRVPTQERRTFELIETINKNLAKRVPTQERRTFELIETINENLAKEQQVTMDEENMNEEELVNAENRVIKNFMSLSPEEKSKIVQKIANRERTEEKSKIVEEIAKNH